MLLLTSIRERDNKFYFMNPGEIRDFQVSRAARTLEVEMQMRKKRISRAQAIRETDEKRIEELDILADIAAFKEQAGISMHESV